MWIDASTYQVLVDINGITISFENVNVHTPCKSRYNPEGCCFECVPRRGARRASGSLGSRALCRLGHAMEPSITPAAANPTLDSATNPATNQQALETPRSRRPVHRACSEEIDPLYMPFTTSKSWIPTTKEVSKGEAKRRFTQKWTLQQVHALEDGVRM